MTVFLFPNPHFPFSFIPIFNHFLHQLANNLESSNQRKCVDCRLDQQVFLSSINSGIKIPIQPFYRAPPFCPSKNTVAPLPKFFCEVL
ncbi:hypothetical protein V2J09_004629 [Rumex salicifolius]